MKTLYESILNSVGAGKDSDECFRRVFMQAISNAFGKYIYEKGLDVYIEGDYSRVYYPLVNGREREFTLKKFEPCIKSFVKELGEYKEPYYAQEGITRKNNIDDIDEPVPIRAKIYLNCKVPMWKNMPYFFIGVLKDASTNKPAWLCVDAISDQIKKLYNK